MKKLTKAIMLSAVLGASVMTAIPAQAWWGGGPWDRGGWGPWDRGGWGGRDSYDDWDWGPWDGSGWGDATFSLSGGGRGYGRGNGRNWYRDYDSWGPYGGGPYGGYGPGYYGGGPYGGGYGPRYGDDYYDYDRPRRRPPRDASPPPPEESEGGKTK